MHVFTSQLLLVLLLATLYGPGAAVRSWPCVMRTAASDLEQALDRTKMHS